MAGRLTMRWWPTLTMIISAITGLWLWKKRAWIISWQASVMWRTCCLSTNWSIEIIRTIPIRMSSTLPRSMWRTICDSWQPEMRKESLRKDFRWAATNNSDCSRMQELILISRFATLWAMESYGQERGKRFERLSPLMRRQICFWTRIVAAVAYALRMVILIISQGEIFKRRIRINRNGLT